MPDLAGIGLALALGLLVGLQRGWAQREGKAGSRFAGIRTFGLLGLAGGVAGSLVGTAQPLATILLAATAALILIGYWRTTLQGGSISGTASIAGLLTLACGFLAATGKSQVATTIAVSMVVLLALRSQLHRLVGRLSELEVAAVARFALIAAVILPMLPDSAYGPYAAWNPRSLWLVVVLVSGFSLAGYIAAKLLGPSRGTIAVSAAGSMVSSTAVTAALAHRMKDPGETSAILHTGIAVASATMFLRVMVLVAVLAPFALATFAALAAPGLAVSLIGAAWFISQARNAHPAPAAAMTVKNPFDIKPALLLMALVMATTLAANWVLAEYGGAGLAVVLALTGSVDVDSAIITLGQLPPGSLTPRIAGMVLAVPVVLNSLVKAGAAAGIAGWRNAGPSVLVLAASAGAVLVATVVSL